MKREAHGRSLRGVTFSGITYYHKLIAFIRDLKTLEDSKSPEVQGHMINSGAGEASEASLSRSQDRLKS